MSGTRARPAAFRLDTAEPDVEIAPPVETTVPVRTDRPDDPEPATPVPARKNRLVGLFWTGIGVLVSLGFGLAAASLVEELFARAQWLGYVGLVGLALVLVAGLALLIREWLAIRRLARFDRLRAEAEEAIKTGDDKAAGRIADALVAAYGGSPASARGRAAYEAATRDQVIDGAQKLRLVEREILEPIDREATRLVAAAARRVSVVTAVSPRAAVDLAMVVATAVHLIRRLSELYGGRPGFFAFWKLARHVAGHMALTGGMAVGDTILDQLVGHGLAARLSAKLGEGVLNGLLTARLGVAAIRLIRPLPFIAAPEPDIRDLVGDAITGGGQPVSR